MKFALATCALVAILAGPVVHVRAQGSLDDTLKELLESFKQSMVCGIPDLGIPVLAPFALDHFEANINQQGLSFKGELDNVLLDGLNEFEIVDLHVNLLKLQLTFELHFGSLRSKGNYRAKGRVAAIFPFNRKGKFRFNVNGLTVKGSAKVGLSGENVQVRELLITPTVKSVNSDIKNVFLLPLNTFIFNRIVEGVVPGAINDNQDSIAATIQDALMPVLNEALADLTLQDLLDMASGEGSGLPVTC